MPDSGYGTFGLRYDFFWFADGIESSMVLDRMDEMLRATGGWNAGRTGGAYRTWIHVSSGQEVAMAAAGFRPLVMSIGAPRTDGSAPQPHAGAVAIARLAASRVATELGARSLFPAAVLQLVAQGQLDYEHWADTQQRMAELTAQLTTRICPSCNRRAAAYATRCRLCRYRFTRADDLARDTQTSKAAGELRALRKDQEPDEVAATPATATAVVSSR